jgi:hypothetical protein
MCRIRFRIKLGSRSGFRRDATLERSTFAKFNTGFNGLHEAIRPLGSTFVDPANGFDELGEALIIWLQLFGISQRA